MTQSVSVARRIRRPADDASAFITDMHKLVPAVSTFKRCEFICDSEDGQVWDVFMQSGTIYLGGLIWADESSRPPVPAGSVGGPCAEHATRSKHSSRKAVAEPFSP
jgi:hypothetical protein